MGIDSNRVGGKLKFVHVVCDQCGETLKRKASQSISKVCRRADELGWDTSRYFPGDIYCPGCVKKHGIKPVGFDGKLNMTEPKKDQE